MTAQSHAIVALGVERWQMLSPPKTNRANLPPVNPVCKQTGAPRVADGVFTHPLAHGRIEVEWYVELQFRVEVAAIERERGRGRLIDDDVTVGIVAAMIFARLHVVG